MDWFATQLINWQRKHGRQDLPWQNPITPYRVWISEIMLQQTQVATVIPYFEAFMRAFPDVRTLADASQDEVLHHWTGLGYYARARNLHKAALIVCQSHAEQLPASLELLTDLPGIGRSTAGAILSIAHNVRAPILDGNVKRVLARFHSVEGYPGITKIADQLWSLSDQHTPDTELATYTQASMDLGATLCTRASPSCDICPLHERCAALKGNLVEQLPTRKPKKDKPVRTCRMFLIQREDGACFLERNSDDGIWGGLYSPPKREVDCLPNQLAAELGLPFESDACILSRFRHTFTHYHLDIEPVVIQLTSADFRIRTNERYAWYFPDGEEKLGLSAVAVKLLKFINARNNSELANGQMSLL